MLPCGFDRTFKRLWKQVAQNLDVYRTFPRLAGGDTFYTLLLYCSCSARSCPLAPLTQLLLCSSSCRVWWEELPLRALLSRCRECGEGDGALSLRVWRPEVLSLLQDVRRSKSMARHQATAVGCPQTDSGWRRESINQPTFSPFNWLLIRYR